MTVRHRVSRAYHTSSFPLVYGMSLSAVLGLSIGATLWWGGGVRLSSEVSSAAPSATLRIVPAAGTHILPTPFTVEVLLDSSVEKSTAIDITIPYSATLEFVSSDTTGSIFPQEITPLEQGDHALHIQRIDFSGGFKGIDGRVIRLTFNPLLTGNATISVDAQASAVYALSDGSNILQNVSGGNYLLEEAGDGNESSSQATNNEGGGGGGGGGRDNEDSAVPSDGGTLPQEEEACLYAQKEDMVIPQKQGKLQMTVDGKNIVYRDVSTKSWFAPFVMLLLEQNVVSGYRSPDGELLGLYGPSDPVTYGEIAKMALELVGEDVSSVTKSPMNLTAVRHWSKQYIARAEELKFSVYSSTSSLDVNAPAPRGAVIQTILEAARIPAFSIPKNPYTDFDKKTPYANAILTATALKIIQGDTDDAGNPVGTFRGNTAINRAEVAKIIVKVGELLCAR